MSMDEEERVPSAARYACSACVNAGRQPSSSSLSSPLTNRYRRHFSFPRYRDNHASMGGKSFGFQRGISCV